MAADFHDEQDLGQVYDWRLIGRMLVFARPHAWALAGCLALIALHASLALVQPYLLKLAIDRVSNSAAQGLAERAASSAQLQGLAGWYLATVVLGALLEYGQGLWLQVTGQAIIASIRQALYEHLQTLGLAFFDQNPVGRLVTRLTNDVEALNELYTSVLIYAFKDAFFIAGAVCVMWQLDRQLALVNLAVVPLVLASAMLFQKLSRAAWRVVRAKLARINATLAENLSGMRVIQLFARERLQAAEFGAINDEYFHSDMHRLAIFSVFRPLLDFLTTLALVGLIWYGGRGVLAGAIGFGTLYAFTSYNRQLYQPVGDLAEKYNVLQSALAAAERIFQLLATAPGVQDPAGPASASTVQGPAMPACASADVPVEFRVGARPAADPTEPPAVEFREVWFAYSGEAWVLQGVNFRVQRGETVAFVGHTGAGKSTIMSLVARFYDVQRGQVLVDGRDVRDWPQAELRRRVGAVMQDVFLFAGDIAGNIALGEARIDREAIEQAARVVGADPFIRRLPGGYDEPVVERGLTLSAGERQLVSFARALAFDPPVLVLDEATASIDSETESALQQAMKAVARDRTTLIVAHRLSTIQTADCIHVMHKGTIRESGRHQALIAEGGLYHQLWQLQFEGAPTREAQLERGA